MSGHEFELLAYRHNWGENRVMYRDGRGRVCSLPASWTSLAPPDPYVTVSAGRSLLRLDDLLTLVDVVQQRSLGETSKEHGGLQSRRV